MAAWSGKKIIDTSGVSHGIMSLIGSGADNITVYYKAAAGSWTSLGTRTDSSYTGAGYVGLTMYYYSDRRLDDFGGGTR
jgi:hypothetical protein